MARWSMAPLQVPCWLDEVVHRVRYQPRVWWSHDVRAKRSRIGLSVVLAVVWWWLQVKALGASWAQGAALALVGGALLWCLLYGLERTGVVNFLYTSGRGCCVDFEHRVVRLATRAPHHTGQVIEQLDGWYVYARWDLQPDPGALWSIGVVESGHRERSWNIELRHRSQGPVARLATVHSTALPARGTAHMVDDWVDVLCQRLGVRRSGSRLKAVKRRQ